MLGLRARRPGKKMGFGPPARNPFFLPGRQVLNVRPFGGLDNTSNSGGEILT